MNQKKSQGNKRAPVWLHIAMVFFLVGSPIVIGYAPLRRLFTDTGFISTVCFVSLLAWVPAFLWIFATSTMRDTLLSASYLIVSVLLLMSSGMLAVVLFAGLDLFFSILGIEIGGVK
jgi:hypothetical protein